MLGETKIFSRQKERFKNLSLILIILNKELQKMRFVTQTSHNLRKHKFQYFSNDG